MKQKIVFLVVCVLIFSAVFTVAPHQVNAGSKITIWTTGSEDESEVLKAAAAAWSTKTGNTAEVVPLSWNDAYTKILAAVTSSSGPDIITGGLSYGIDLGQKGGMVDLNKAYPADVKQIKAADVQGLWESIVAPDGAVFGIPYDLTIYQMYYRADILKEAGINSAPATWDELTAAVKAVQKKNDGKGGGIIQWGNTQWLYYANLLYQAGGDFYNAECTKATINSPEGVKALEYFASLYRDLNFSKDGWPDMEGGLDSGQYPIGMSGSFVAGALDNSKPDMKGKWATAKLPAGPSGKSTAFIGGRVIGITSFSKAQDTAWDFIKFLQTEAAVTAMQKMASDKGLAWIPPQVASYDLMWVPAGMKESFKAQLAEAKGPPPCSGWEEASKDVQTLLEKVILEDADPQDALDEAAAEMDAALAGKPVGTAAPDAAATMEPTK